MGEGGDSARGPNGSNGDPDAGSIWEDRPDPATYVGSGKADELAATGTALDIDLVVFDEELSPAQQRNLEQIFGCDVVDRVALILDLVKQLFPLRTCTFNLQEDAIRVDEPSTQQLFHSVCILYQLRF